MVLSANFRLIEFSCRCGCLREIEVSPDPGLIQALQLLRDKVGPLHVTSGVRCRTHNTRIGGAPRSMHLTGMAADVVSRHFSPEELAEQARLIPAIKGIGIARSFLHVDVREVRAEWRY